MRGWELHFSNRSSIAQHRSTQASQLQRLDGRDAFDDMERFVRAGADEGVTHGVVRSAARSNSCPNRPEPGRGALTSVAAVVSHHVPAMVPVPHHATMAAMTMHAVYSDLGSDRKRIDCADDAGGGRRGRPGLPGWRRRTEISLSASSQACCRRSLGAAVDRVPGTAQLRIPFRRLD